jgi:hypothetical protein
VTREDVEDFVALALLNMPPEERKLDDAAIMVLGHFAQRAGIALGAAEKDMLAAVGKYLEQHPPKQELWGALARIAREELARGGAVGGALGKVTGAASATGPLGGNGERPEGSTPAGPLARFLVQPKKK